MTFKKSTFLITKPQISYIEILAVDLCLSRRQRNGVISMELDRKIEYLDEMTKDEGSRIIEYLKRLKEDNNIKEAALAEMESRD